MKRIFVFLLGFLLYGFSIFAQSADESFAKARSLAEFGDFIAAIKYYTEAISYRANFTEAYVSRGQAKERNNDPKGALFDYDMAVAIDSNYVRAYNCRGQLFSTQKRYKEAIVDFNKALSMQPNYANAYINRGLARLALRDTLHGCNDFVQAGILGKARGDALHSRYCKNY